MKAPMTEREAIFHGHFDNGSIGSNLARLDMSERHEQLVSRPEPATSMRNTRINAKINRLIVKN